jgi:hypothetical protein
MIMTLYEKYGDDYFTPTEFNEWAKKNPELGRAVTLYSLKMSDEEPSESDLAATGFKPLWNEADALKREQAESEKIEVKRKWWQFWK